MFSDPDSSADELRLLAIGDVHLGTRPSRLPTDLADYGVEARDLTPEAALGTVVRHAIADRVDAVLFAGDVVESTNARFEALRPLEAAVRQLGEAGIPVLGVVGNHDVEALPRLARMIDGFRILGEGGTWEGVVLTKDERPAAEIVGWSFPHREVRTSPVADWLRDPLPPAAPGVPRLGLLHGDLDASGGNYAPFSSRELAAAGLDAWLLGHIHKPSLASGATSDGGGPRGYLGSLVGLDPGEMGPHGPWLIRVTRDGRILPRHVPMAPLRWESCDVPVGENESVDDVADRLVQVATEHTQDLQAQGLAPLVLGLRPRLVGATRHYEALRSQLESGRWRGLARPVGETVFFIDKVLDGLSLAVDLDEVARGDDPPALLARMLKELATPGEARERLLESAREALATRVTQPVWGPLETVREPEDPLTDEALIGRLSHSGTVALHGLLAQRRDRQRAQHRDDGSAAG